MQEFEGILFLDVDGVLNSFAWYKSKEYKIRQARFNIEYGEQKKDNDYYLTSLSRTSIDPIALKNLNSIFQRLDLGIVVSSTWRRYPPAMQALAECGILGWDRRFMGATPVLKMSINKFRGDEIKSWIDEHDYKGKFVILDDEGDLEPLTDRLVRTSLGTGLTTKDVEKVIELFR